MILKYIIIKAMKQLRLRWWHKYIIRFRVKIIYLEYVLLRNLFRNKLYINNIMSANRSVQAAQRRRVGPQDGGMPVRGPQPSINSAQMFANQARPGQGPSIPSGRLAGQQAAMQQKQMQQQSQQQKTEGVAGVSKMTIAQAITLITLRLGAVETKIMELEHESPSHGMSFDGQENMVLIDKTVIQSITSRLESLEKRSSTGSASGSASGPEVTLLKQQFETVKQAVVQTKGATVTIVKDNKELKNQVDSLKNELTETRELLTALQNLTMDNSQKIMELSSGDFQNVDEQFFQTDQGDNDYNTLIGQTDSSEIQDLQEDSGSDEIVGTNLKELIESEINADL
jgi:hypothetical protein